MASANIVLEIGSHCHPPAVAIAEFETFLGSHVCHLFMDNAQVFASDIVSFVGCFMRNI